MFSDFNENKCRGYGKERILIRNMKHKKESVMHIKLHNMNTVSIAP